MIRGNKRLRIAVISDIHGNYPALAAVLADAKEQKTEEYIFAGDYCLSGPYINECVDAIRAIPGAHIVRGNEEGYLERLIGTDESEWTDGQMQISYYSFRTITKDNLEYLMNLPGRIDIERNGVSIHVTHDKGAFLGDIDGDHWSSSRLSAKYAGKTVSQSALKRDIREANETDDLLQERLASLADGVYIFGHTHIQWSYQARNGRITLLNPGSCGLPLDCLTGTVPYVILEISESGKVTVDERRVPFDTAEYAKSLQNSGQFTDAPVWTKVIMKELTTAREHLIPFLTYLEGYAQRIGDDRRPYVVETWECGYASWNRTILPYRAIIVDLDRTLLRTDKSISEFSKHVLRDWQESGAEVFIASARPERAITEYRDSLGVTSYTTLNGARTFTPHGTIDNEIATDCAIILLEKLAEIPGTVISIEATDGLYSNTCIDIWQPIVTDHLTDVAMREGVYKVLASHPNMSPEELVQTVGELPADVYYTIADSKLVQFMSRTATKWNGIRQMLTAAGIPADQAIYFGDDHDDMEPIENCGLGVAVANALPQVKEKADIVAPSNDEDGVAVLLRRLENGLFCE